MTNFIKVLKSEEASNILIKEIEFVSKKIETVGQTFDPEIHEAVSSVQDDKYGEKEIVQEFRTGYMVGNKVIRHAMVVVAN